MNRKSVFIIVMLMVATVALFATAKVRAQTPAEDKGLSPSKVAPLMRLKLDRAKNILAGLTLEQFDQIASNARSLKLLSTEAGWNIIQTEEFRRQSDDFRRACDSLEKSAKAKDVHRAALGYVALTVRCVECHSYMREHKIKLASSTPHLKLLSSELLAVQFKPSSRQHQQNARAMSQDERKPTSP